MTFFQRHLSNFDVWFFFSTRYFDPARIWNTNLKKKSWFKSESTFFTKTCFYLISLQVVTDAKQKVTAHVGNNEFSTCFCCVAAHWNIYFYWSALLYRLSHTKCRRLRSSLLTQHKLPWKNSNVQHLAWCASMSGCPTSWEALCSERTAAFVAPVTHVHIMHNYADRKPSGYKPGAFTVLR